MKHYAAVRDLVDFFHTVSPATVPRVREIYAVDAKFKDPFNNVQGIDAIQHLFSHMFEQVRDPVFVVTGQVMQNDDLFLTWEFIFSMPPYVRKVQTMHGVTHFVFDAESRVCVHRDYWDAAEEVYEKLPVLGGFMRLLKRIARR